ncbi:MAG: ABC transporter ATP-binding protein [Nitrospinae bacterium]|nr:ABC transporter ATP-binding protein [Nitrospinota bacterium]MZH04384.1 ABC transporter ATP-binding protein [Nitrospinota bacterium]
MRMDTLQAFLPYVRKYRREFLLGIIALIVTDTLTLVVPWLIKEFIDALSGKPVKEQLFKYVTLLVLISLGLMLGRFGWRKYMFGLSRKIEFDILNDLFQHLLSLDRLWYQKQKTGDLMSRATNDLRAVREFFGLGVLILIDAVFVIIMAVAMMSFINIPLALKVFIPLPFISVLFFFFVREIGRRHKEVQEHLSRITERVQENLSGIRVLHAFVQEEYEKKKFEKLNLEYIQKNLRVTQIFGIFTPTMVFSMGIAGMISLWMGGKAVIAEEITLGSFVAFNGYLMLLSWPMMGIGYVFNLSQKGLVGMGRIKEVFSARAQIIDKVGNKNYIPDQGELELTGVFFSYPVEEKNILKDINLKVSPGQTLGIVGVIGSGKTTLAHILLRFYDPVSGDILIDGKSIKEVPLKELRGCIGYVSQEPFLFSTSIRNNIALGMQNVSDSEIEEIIQISGLESDLKRFPDHIETLVGEKGVTLSGGQKQRIALARALLKNPKVLILDDSFSNLDSEMEEMLLENLMKNFINTTKIIISHRLSTIKNADKIVVVTEGEISEQGTHSQLMKRRGVYADLFRNQELTREMEIIL